MKVKTLKQAVRLANSLSKRKIREAENCFLIEGLSFVEEALKSKAALEFLIYSERVIERERGRSVLGRARLAKIPLFPVDDGIFKKLAETETPQGILAVGRILDWPEEGVFQQPQGIYLVLDAIQDPGNLGTMIRTGEGMGVHAVFLGKGTVDVYNSKVLRATMGSIFRVPTFRDQDLTALVKKMKDSGVRLVAADPRAGTIYYRTDLIHPRLALLVGNEGRGIGAGLLREADERVSIPLQGGVESLNAAVATALILYEIHRQKHCRE